MGTKDNKRPFGDDECQHVHKLPRHQDSHIQLTFGAEIAPCIDVYQKAHSEGDENINRFKTERNMGNSIQDLSFPLLKELSIFPGSISGLGWHTCNTSEDNNIGPLELFHPSGSPEHDQPCCDPCRPKCIYPPLDYSPQKLVYIGPEHQADIPECGFSGSDASTDYLTRMLGTSVISMPDFDSSTRADIPVGFGRTDCNCPDMGSIRCVREHVSEAREQLKKTLGSECFINLGFCEMGEEVAQRWNEEDKHIFHKVFSHPTNEGMNFWDHLSLIFPSRTKKELVSYYFNVLMLRKRALQNRSNPVYVDSDCEEWPENDGSEYAMKNEDADSLVDPPMAHSSTGESYVYEPKVSAVSLNHIDEQEPSHNNDIQSSGFDNALTIQENRVDSKVHYDKSCNLDSTLHEFSQ